MLTDVADAPRTRGDTGAEPNGEATQQAWAHTSAQPRRTSGATQLDPRLSSDPFADVWEANAAFSEHFPWAGLGGTAASGLALVTCMDTRIDPLAVLGQQPGHAKIIRTAGARVTDDVLRSLVLAANLLGAHRVLVVAHTDCGLVGDDDGVRTKVGAALGLRADDPELRTYEPLAIEEPTAALAADVARIRQHPLLPDRLVVGAAVYDVATGRLDPVEV